MGVRHHFKRSFYYEVENAIKNSSVTFLLGARRCGKTFCMKQLYDCYVSGYDFDNVIYVDVKKEYRDKYEKILYLIDEVTYLHYPDKEIMKVQDAFTSGENNNTRVVFAGMS